MRKLTCITMALLLVLTLCSAAFAELGVHPYQKGAPGWAKEIADKGGPKGFATQVKEKYGEAKGEAMLESLVPQKGPIEGVTEEAPLPKSAMPIVDLAWAFGFDIDGGGFDIGGTGIIGATISLIVASINQSYTGIVDGFGKWYFEIFNDDPNIDQAVYAGDKYVVTQTEPGKSTSDPVTGTFV